MLELLAELDLGQEHSQIYLDVNVDREPRGRITVELFPDVPVGAQVLPPRQRRAPLYPVSSQLCCLALG